MTPISTLLVDDEPLALTNLAALLARDPDVRIVGECRSGIEAVAFVRNQRPDLIFLDVQMPGCDGFDVLEQLGADAPRAVVFVTAYDRYALQAFEAEALDFLLKPFSDARFFRVLARAKAQLDPHGAESKHTHRMMVKSCGRVVFLRVHEIDWIEAADYYACLHVGGKTHLLRRSMAELERDLDPKLFCRIHRSTIVNVTRIRELRLDSNGDYEVLLEDGMQLRLSRGYREQLQARLFDRTARIE